MKFSVSSSALLSLLATTGKVISNKNTLPILDYFLMELKGNELRVTTSDLETTLVGSIRVDGVESEGTIAAPAKLMLDSLKEFAEMPLTIEVNDQNWEIRLSWKSGSLSIPGASAVSYPAIPALSADCKELTLDVDVLVNGDGNNNAAANTAVESAGKLTYTDLVNFWNLFDPYELNTIIAAPAQVAQMLGISEFRDAAAGLNFHATGEVITPLGADLIKGSCVPAGKIIGIDRSCALEMVTTGPVSTEYDKLIDRQLERAVISSTAGFARIFDSAARTLTV